MKTVYTFLLRYHFIKNEGLDWGLLIREKWPYIVPLHGKDKQTFKRIIEIVSYPSVLTFVVDAQKNNLSSFGNHLAEKERDGHLTLFKFLLSCWCLCVLCLFLVMSWVGL